ncbi:MAG: ATP-binding protein [Actinomycetia bacterium]|nr:ATP-binding protein [Actinomycetes bacterium]
MFHRKIINYLVKWKDKRERKPLVIRGARQVGKTSAVLMFAKKYFKNIINLNLEKSEHLSLFREPVSIEDFEKIIQIKFHQKIIPGKTLVFIDEIQNSPSLIKLLRFFYEEKPDIHVIAAGSLLQAKIEREGLSMPVGRVEYVYLYPLDFFEYLEVKGERELLNFLKDVYLEEHIPRGIHDISLKLFYEYTMVGGMPEIVKIFLEKKDIENLRNIYSSIFTSYTEDVFKYTSLANSKYLAYVIETAPLFAGTNIKYERFGSSDYRSREMSRAFYTLEKVMILYQVQKTNSKNLPLIGKRREPKLLFLDIGLVNYQMGIQENFINLKNLNDFYRGRIAEQVVGQNILAQFINYPPKIFYWAREKPKGSAEIDFCLNRKGYILGIEVKSGKSGRLKSLFSFGDLVKNSILIRIYSGELKKENIQYSGKNFTLFSLPFYLVPRILEIF